MSSICFGTWQVSASSWSTSDLASVRDAIAYAAERGVASFDTAPGYGDGKAEQLLGEVLRGNKARVQLLTKVPPDMLTAPLVRKSVVESLQRLGVSEVDTVFIHWPAGTMGTPLVPVDETLGELERLRSEGLIRKIGLSNFAATEARELVKKYKLEALQYSYSLLWRTPEFGVLELSQAHRQAFYAYSPVGMGLLFGRRIEDVLGAQSDHRKYTKLFGKYLPQTRAALGSLQQRYGGDANALATASLRWLMAKNAIPLIGLKERSTVDFALRAVEAGPLPADEVAALDALTKELKEVVGEDYSLWG